MLLQLYIASGGHSPRSTAVFSTSHEIPCLVPVFMYVIVILQLAVTVNALLILTITLRVHPYDQNWVNLTEGFILLDLVLISAYFLDNNRLSNTANNDIVVVLLILPFIYSMLYFLTKISW